MRSANSGCEQVGCAFLVKNIVEKREQKGWLPMIGIRILGLRPYTDADGKESLKEWTKPEWIANSIPDLFSNLDKYVGMIPRDNRWNMYYSVAEILPGRGRVLAKQTVTVFDIDSIGESSPEDVAQCAISALGLEWAKTGIVASGHGVHLIIQMPEARWIHETSVFEAQRPVYKIVCARVQAALQAEKLDGKVDDCVHKATQLLRLPSTENRKPGMPAVKAVMLNG